ncbi:MAG: hypothetical protein HYR63_24435, partial [Proteobacteria bacterium]|nr:hypothetical protein [Pseudomonadota bacterium]
LPAAALALTERSLAIQPRASQARLNAIALARAQNDLPRLLKHLDAALAQHEDQELRSLRAHTWRALKEGPRRIDHDNLAESSNYAAMLNSAGRLQDASLVLRRTLALHPAAAAAWNNFSFGKLLAGRLGDALRVASIGKAIAPELLATQLNLAAALDALDLDGVDLSLRCGIALEPGSQAALQALARRFSRTMQWGRFETWIGRAQRLAPNDPEVALALAHAHLVRGDMQRGWRYWEGRLSRPDLSRPDLHGALWTGQELHGATIVIHAEQGFGETLQFIRFVKAVAALGGRVILEVQPELASLVARAFPDVPVARRGETLPPHDWHCPVPSLPSVLAIGAEQLPGPMPYLAPDADAVQVWCRRLACHRRPWVGMCWRGNPRFADDRRRSPGLVALSSVLDCPDVSFVSMTRDPSEADAPMLSRLLDTGEFLESFDQTAALIGALDLVITSDTAIAHLAGALAVPVWLLLAHAADWRWLLDRSDNPWYPTARLFRQPNPGNWAFVVASVSKELCLWSSSSRARSASAGSIGAD